jgi:hypothetical protein
MERLEEFKIIKSNGNTEIGIKSLFNKLSTKRKKDAEVLLDFEYRGIWETAIKKYSSNAHFVYELLQNADDVKATWVKFELEANGLWFKHNGKNFSISDIDTTESDTHSGKLGNLNAITSIGNSSKIDDQKIGKFGIGFKSVFAYSSTAKIYDNNFSFELVNYIIPIEIEPLSEKLRNDETWFYFPFNRDGISKEKAFSDISQKLKNLEHPILFLPNLKEISWATQAENGTYTKEIKYDEQFDDIKTQRISLVENNGRDIWLFTRNIIQEGKTHKCAVGFFLNAQMKLDISKKHAAFCFFPTKENTNLKFIIQAPFLLTDNREKLVAGDDWNKLLINHLANLAADSLLLLRDIGIKDQSPLIDDSLISLIPYKETDFAKLDDKDKISFLPFCSAIKKKLQSEPILPGIGGGYGSKNIAYWASGTELTELFSDAAVAELMAKPNAKWVFPSLGRNIILSEKENNLPLKTNYIDSLVSENIDPEKLLRRITASFIEKQSFDWLDKLYAYLTDKPSYQMIVKKKPIFINNEGKAIQAYSDNGNLVLFWPSEAPTEYPTIHKDFVSREKAIEFFRKFEIGTPSLKDEIFNKIIPYYKGGFNLSDVEKLKNHFIKFFDYFIDCEKKGLTDNNFISQLKDIKFTICKSEKNSNSFFVEAQPVLLSF